MITLKEKLKAIKGSIDKWDKISRGEMEDRGMINCPLCQLYISEAEEILPCGKCPIKTKTGKELCLDTPYDKYKEAENFTSFDRETKLTARQEYLAGTFRDWLKDLYTEVSEAEGGSNG